MSNFFAFIRIFEKLTEDIRRLNSKLDSKRKTNDVRRGEILILRIENQSLKSSERITCLEKNQQKKRSTQEDSYSISAKNTEESFSIQTAGKREKDNNNSRVAKITTSIKTAGSKPMPTFQEQCIESNKKRCANFHKAKSRRIVDKQRKRTNGNDEQTNLDVGGKRPRVGYAILKMQSTLIMVALI